MVTNFMIRKIGLVTGVLFLSFTNPTHGNDAQHEFYAYAFLGSHEQIVIRENGEIASGDLVYEWSDKCQDTRAEDVRCFHSRVMDLSIPSNADVGYRWTVGNVYYEVASRDRSTSLLGKPQELFRVAVTRVPDKKMNVTDIYYSPETGVIGFKVAWADGSTDVALLAGEQGLWSEKSFVE